jgi:hypothetical protein
MRGLLGGAPGAIKDCLRTQLGSVAARNSCSGPWQPSLDFQVNWRPSFLGLDRRLTASLVTVNFLGGLDQWLHGAANLHGWGFATAPDPVLLYVRGFDPGTDQYRYAVNGRFGSTLGANGGVTAPFQIGIQVHMTVGPDRTRDRLRTVFGGRGGARGGFGGGGARAAGVSDFAARFAQILPNPIPAILGFRDSLHFTADQTTRLQAIADSLDRVNQALADSMHADIQRAGDRPEPGVLFARLRPKLAQGREHIRKALDQVRGVLTAEQWAKIPEALKSPGRGPRRQ